MKPLFKTAAGKKEILDLYDQKLSDLNIQFETKTISTSFGDTHLIITGQKTHPPLLLIHGSNACAPIALEAYPELQKKYQVIAVDVLAQPNKSEENRLSMKDNSYGEWVDELIVQLQITNVTLVGFSFGGLIILKTLISKPDNIKEVYLTAPAFIVNGNPIKALVQVFWPMKRFMKSKKQAHIESFLHALFSRRDAFAIQYLSAVFDHFEMDFTPVPTISKKEAQHIKTPIHLFAADRDIMFPGVKMIRRAKKILPSLVHAQLLENSKHVQGKNHLEIIQDAILKN